MRRLLLIFLFFVLRVDAASVTAYVSTTSVVSATSYASGSFTPNVGDLLFALVVAKGTQDQGSMTDSQSLGFALAAAFTPYASSVNAIYVFVSARPAANTSMTVTYQTPGTTGTGVVIFVGGVSGMTRAGPGALRQIKSAPNQAIGTPSIALNNSVLTGNPTVAVIGNSTNPALTSGNPPSGWTEQSDTGNTALGGEWVSRNSGFTGTTLTWGTSSATAWGGIAIEFDTTSPPSNGVWPTCTTGVPCLIQDRTTNWPGEAIGPALYIHYPNSTIAGNLLFLKSYHDGNVTVSSVATDCGGTWVQGPHGSTATEEALDMWYLPNNAGSCSLVTITFSAALSGNFLAHSEIGEVSDIATSSPVDGTSTIATSTGQPVSNPGAITTTQNGDFVWNTVGWNAPFDFPSNRTPVVALDPDNAGVLMTAHGAMMNASQFIIQPFFGSINPSFYADDPSGQEQPFYSGAIAFKASSGAGGRPAAGSIRIVREIDYTSSEAGTITKHVQFPATGNLRLFYSSDDVAEGWTFANVGDNDNASYTLASTTANCTASYNTNFPQFFYSANQTGDQFNFMTWQQVKATWIVMADVANAKAAPFDTCTVANGTQGATNGDITSAPTYTPSVANELVENLQTNAAGPPCGTVINSPAACNSTSTVGFTLDSIWATSMTDLDTLSTGDGYQHTYTTSTSTINFGWHMKNSPNVTTWHAIAIGFEQAPAVGGGSCTFALLGVGKC